MTEEETLSGRSQLLVSFVNSLNESGVAYAIMNNYEGLPREIPSDVDFTVQPDFFASLDQQITEFAKTHDATIVQKLWHGNRKCAYILAAKSAPEYEFIQLDFFVEFSTKGCPALLTHQELMKDSRPYRFFVVPAPEVELLFTVMRRLFKNDWDMRHCERVRELHTQVQCPNPYPERYLWAAEIVDLACRLETEKLRTRRQQDWEMLQKTARASMSIPKRIENATTQARRILSRLRNETGYLAVIHGGKAVVDNNATESLDTVFHRRLVIDNNWLRSAGRHSFSRLSLELALLKRRKGLVFVEVDTKNSECQRVAKWLDRLGLVDQVLVGDEEDQASMKYSAPHVRIDQPHEFIEAILDTQSRKTATAIGRGGTQTSE